MLSFSSHGPKYILEEGSSNKIDEILKFNNIKFLNCIVFVDIFFKNKKLPFKHKKYKIEYYN